MDLVPIDAEARRGPGSRASWLIYGATGYSGQNLARLASRRGLRPLLAGRHEGRLRALAAELGLAHRTASLEGGVDPLLADVEVVINAAGPFEHTCQPLVEACLRAGCHYLDLSGEVTAIAAVARHDARARAAGVMLMPSVGFEVVGSNCLTTHVWSRAPNATRLRVAIAGLDLLSRGSARTALAELGRPVLVRRGGQLVDIPSASMRRAFDFGAGPRPAVVVSFADLVSAYYATGIGDIEVYCAETPMLSALLAASQTFGFARHLPWARSWMDWQVGTLPPGPSEHERRGRQAVVVVEAEDARGEVRRARLTTPEAYTFTSETTLAVIDRVLRGDLEPGFQTPGRVYGPGLLASLNGVLVEDLP